QLHEKYWPTFWCFGTHAQTALANAIRGALPNLKYQREVILMPDGGQVSLDWYDAPRLSPDRFSDSHRPIALFMPGLTGDSNTEYIKSLIPNAHAVGYRYKRSEHCKFTKVNFHRVVAFNNRGRGGMKLLTPRLYCAANCDDVRYVLERIKTKHPKAQIVAIGVSLGGIVLCRYLTETGDKALVDAAMLISVAYDLVAGSESMSRNGLNKALNNHLARSLCTIVADQKEVLQPLKEIDYDEVLKSSTLRDFDERFTIKMWGFESSDHYYREASNKGKLNLIKRPTLCVSAADDMFAPLYSLPIEEIEKSSHVGLVVTQKGGHIGFMEGFLPTLPFFSERLLKQYLSALIKLDDIKNNF
ncbi:phospholipase ABHD3-like protein, partial [Leptotrombidium deliense]